MATYSFDVTTYGVFLYGGPTGNDNAAATVYLSTGEPSIYVHLRFYHNDVPLPANIKTGPTLPTYYYVSYRYEQLASVLDILRDEKQVTFFFNENTLASYIKQETR